MHAIYIDRRDAALAWRDGAVEVRTPGSSPQTIPLRGVARLVVMGSATLSAGLLAQCWERDVGVLVLSGRRASPTARFYGAPHSDATLRVDQAVLSRNPLASARLAREVAAAKLVAQARLLRKLGQSRPGGRALTEGVLTQVLSAASRLREDGALTADMTRGVEGAAAAAYFRALSGFFPPSLGFAERNRRPPRDPVNATLSLGYVLAGFEAGRQAQMIGLDPAIGALHALAPGRDSLALDLVEPARPKIDAFAQDLFLRRVLRCDHFRAEPDGAVLMGKAGRAAFYAAFEDFAPGLSRYLRGVARAAAKRVRAMAQETTP
ncbi:MAG: CRISPR-associated endonuclease Cas1 [Gammaproteobacteria bacterium]|nr:CRISPR-associated endonuclease Cas1 [Gammaproteobacteria bacterium]